MAIKPGRADGYDFGQVDRVKSTCLYLATKLGDLMPELVVVGGLVPSLLIDQQSLPADSSTHVGTMDLDLGLAFAMVDDERYQEVVDRLRAAGFEPDENDAGVATRQRWRIASPPVTVDFLIEPASDSEAKAGKLFPLTKDWAAIIAPGLHLAFVNNHVVQLTGKTIMGESATREIRVCGAGAFVVLKSLALRIRGENKAYQWAEKRRLETHPRTGAAQLVEIRETVREIEVPAYVEATPPAATPCLAGGHPWRGCQRTTRSLSLRDDLKHHLGILSQRFDGFANLFEPLANQPAGEKTLMAMTIANLESNLEICRRAAATPEIPATWLNKPEIAADRIVKQLTADAAISSLQNNLSVLADPTKLPASTKTINQFVSSTKESGDTNTIAGLTVKLPETLHQRKRELEKQIHRIGPAHDSLRRVGAVLSCWPSKPGVQTPSRITLDQLPLLGQAITMAAEIGPGREAWLEPKVQKQVGNPSIVHRTTLVAGHPVVSAISGTTINLKWCSLANVSLLCNASRTDSSLNRHRTFTCHHARCLLARNRPHGLAPQP